MNGDEPTNAEPEPWIACERNGRFVLPQTNVEEALDFLRYLREEDDEAEQRETFECIRHLVR